MSQVKVFLCLVAFAEYFVVTSRKVTNTNREKKGSENEDYLQKNSWAFYMHSIGQNLAIQSKEQWLLTTPHPPSQSSKDHISGHFS